MWTASQPDLDSRRQTMVERQLRRRGIHDARVLAAMARVPRERFVPTQLVPEAYADCALPIGQGQTISQPYMVARMCELAEVAAGDRALEIGGGSGYQAAVLAELCAEVVSVEVLPELAERARENLAVLGHDRVTVVTADGRQGYSPRAPYRAIVVAAAADHVPPELIRQLALGGRLVMPVGSRHLQSLRVLIRGSDELGEHAHDRCVFVPLVGED